MKIWPWLGFLYMMKYISILKLMLGVIIAIILKIECDNLISLRSGVNLEDSK